MTVKEWKEELEFYDDDMEVCFEISGDIPCESWTENRYGEKSVYINENLRETCICQVNSYVNVSLEVDDE